MLNGIGNGSSTAHRIIDIHRFWETPKTVISWHLLSREVVHRLPRIIVWFIKNQRTRYSTFTAFAVAWLSSHAPWSTMRAINCNFHSLCSFGGEVMLFYRDLGWGNEEFGMSSSESLISFFLWRTELSGRLRNTASSEVINLVRINRSNDKGWSILSISSASSGLGANATRFREIRWLVKSLISKKTIWGWLFNECVRTRCNWCNLFRRPFSVFWSTRRNNWSRFLIFSFCRRSFASNLFLYRYWASVKGFRLLSSTFETVNSN